MNRIREALKEAGNPVPEFDCDLFFTLIFKREMEETTSRTAQKGGQKGGQKSSVKTKKTESK